MARENVFKFEELLRTDENLVARLKELADAFEGDRADEAAFFAATIGKLAEEAGVPFSYEDGKELTSPRELSEEELEAVAGGGFCWYVGGSSEPEAECDPTQGHACAYLGVTM